MELNAYLNFNGQCAAAFKFYEQVLGGTIVMMTSHAETPAKEHVAADWQDKIMHAQLEVGGKTVLMGSDAPPAHFLQPQGFSVSIVVATPEEGRRIFTALAEGGKTTMAFQETFWSPGFGMAVDRFGTPWMVNCTPAA